MADLARKINERCEAHAHDPLFLRHAEAVAVVQAVLDAHAEFPDGWCVSCGRSYPCSTLTAVGAALGVCVDQEPRTRAATGSQDVPGGAT